MKPEQQRIAIAEACGWDGIFLDDDRNPCGHQPRKPRHTEWVENSALPDYLNDLNAMHEAWKTLTWSQKGDFAEALRETLGPHVREVVGASAAQRAEAFTKTLNLWKE